MEDNSTSWDNLTTGNETEIQELEIFQHFIYLYIIPVISGFGSLAALLCVIVFSKKQMRSSLNIYLAGLSMFDFLLLAMSIFIYPPMQACLEQGNANTFVCHFFWKSALFTYPLSLIAQTGSVWTCVAVTVDRFLAVSYPLHSKIWCTPRRALAILCTITAISVIYRIPSTFELELGEWGQLARTPLRQNKTYISLHLFYGYLIVMVLVPWSIMIVFNTFVVMAVHKAYKFRRSLQNGSNSEERDRRCTLMALCMIVTFIVFNIMSAFNNLVESFEWDVKDYQFLRIFIPASNLFVCLNSASNIIIYSLFGARFRQVCVQMLCGRNSRWMVWLRAGKQVVSDFEPTREGQTKRTSMDASTSLLGTRMTSKNSYPWSARSSQNSNKRAPYRNTSFSTGRPTVIASRIPIRLSLQQAVL